jgi:hypothetical protein
MAGLRRRAPRPDVPVESIEGKQVELNRCDLLDEDLDAEIEHVTQLIASNQSAQEEEEHKEPTPVREIEEDTIPLTWSEPAPLWEKVVLFALVCAALYLVFFFEHLFFNVTLMMAISGLRFSFLCCMITGHAEAQAIMGQRYVEGDRVAKNETAALEWFMSVSVPVCMCHLAGKRVTRAIRNRRSMSHKLHCEDQCMSTTRSSSLCTSLIHHSRLLALLEHAANHGLPDAEELLGLSVFVPFALILSRHTCQKAHLQGLYGTRSCNTGAGLTAWQPAGTCASGTSV